MPFTASVHTLQRPISGACYTGCPMLFHRHISPLGWIPQAHQSTFHQMNFIFHSFARGNDSGGHLHCSFLSFLLFFHLFLSAGCLSLFYDSLCTECSVRVIDIGVFGCALYLLLLSTWRTVSFPYSAPRWTVTVHNLHLCFLTAVGFICSKLSSSHTVPLGVFRVL